MPSTRQFVVVSAPRVPAKPVGEYASTALRHGPEVFYTTPLKSSPTRNFAISREQFGADQSALMTDDLARPKGLRSW